MKLHLLLFAVVALASPGARPDPKAEAMPYALPDAEAEADLDIEPRQIGSRCTVSGNGGLDVYLPLLTNIR